LWLFLKNNDGIKDIFGFSFVIEILHPVVVQVLFLYLVFFTVPQGELMWVKILIMLRALFLIIFITHPVLNFMGAGLPYDMKFFEGFIGEILTLIASIWLFRELKNRPT
jgi:hypothetical protein